ncbi:MFS transporter [Saccharopolyspora sp. NPDC000359]|uniref:MFS transporter n=1 Tax=Saccharopolyspora sp. NPDC000359 TaxID=3154251 RepID=UPI00332A0A59
MPTEAQPPPGRSTEKSEVDGVGQPRRWRQLALLSGLITADNSETRVVDSLFPTMRTALGLPMSALGLVISLSKLVGVVCAPLWTAAASRFGRKGVLVFCSGAWGVWTAAIGLAQDQVQLVVLSVIAAAGICGGGPLINGILADLFPDRERGKATGMLYGIVALCVAVMAPLLGQLSRIPDGWRYGFFAAGALQVVFGVLVLLFFRDPGVGAADGPSSRPAARRPVNAARLRELLRIRSFQVILGQRLINGQMVIQGFGAVLLTDAYGFSNATAVFVLPAAALGYLAGSFLGGLLGDRAHARNPRTGRAALLSSTTVLYAVVAFFATQIAWPSIAVFAAFFTLVGLLQGFAPGINRPIVMSVTPPDLRGAAFALMFSAEALGWSAATLVVGYLADAVGLQQALLHMVVLATLVGGLLLTLLMRTYPRDATTS